MMTKQIITKPALPQIKPAGLRRFHAGLADWYAAHGRHDLPWRVTADPYAIWISETMLQQTQVATVRSRFYTPFLAQFPSVEALAAAPQEAVLKAWEGLGYYSRARNLHKAAQIVVSRESLVFSEEFLLTTDDSRLTTLLALPGIGRNTAHAILAFGFHQPVAILEANVKRIVARIFALSTPSDAELWAGAERLLNRATPFDYNQAMMDLGSAICTPKNPACEQCPANEICAGKSNPTAYPTPRVKKTVPTREVTILVREDANGRLFLAPREVALLGGLYGFEQVPRKSLVVSREGKNLANDSRLTTHDFLGTVTHTYSHFKLIGHVVHRRLREKMNAPHWHTRAEISALPLSTVDHKVLVLIDNCHSIKKKIVK